MIDADNFKYNNDIFKIIDNICNMKTEEDKLSILKKILDILFDDTKIYIYISDILTHDVVYASNSLRNTFNIKTEKFKCNDIFNRGKKCNFCEEKFMNNYSGESIEYEIYANETDRYFQVIDKVILLGKRKYKFEIITEITEIKKTEQYLLFKLDFENCLKHILELFIGVYDFQDSINLALKEIGSLVKADRAYVLLYGKDKNELVYEYEWMNEYQKVKSNKGISINTNELEWHEKNIKEAPIISYSKNQNIKHEAMIKCSIGAPLIVLDEVIGFIFIEGVNYGIWFDFVFGAIEIYSEIIATGYEKSLFEEELKKKSFCDGLTNINNRTYFEIKINELNKVKPVGILVCDVDGLKLINDNLGHRFGDNILRSVANILKNNISEDDIVFRVGGDEFVVLLPHKDIYYLEQMYEKIKQAIKDHINENKCLPISLSIGYGIKEDENEEIIDTFKMADNLMYSEKYKHRKEKINIIQNYIQNIYKIDTVVE